MLFINVQKDNIVREDQVNLLIVERENTGLLKGEQHPVIVTAAPKVDIVGCNWILETDQSVMLDTFVLEGLKPLSKIQLNQAIILRLDL